jgi:hypothetical protein
LEVVVSVDVLRRTALINQLVPNVFVDSTLVSEFSTSVYVNYAPVGNQVDGTQAVVSVVWATN